MRITNTIVTIAALLVANGCMHSERQTTTQRGAVSAPVAGPPAASVSQPPEPAQSLTNVYRSDELIGQSVLTSDHLQTGKIDDFVIDQPSGRILYAVIGLGGVLGIGETRVGAPPAIFTEAKKGSVEVSVDKHKLAGAPKVPGALDKTSQADFVSNVYGYFGQKGWWGGNPAAAASFNGARKATDLTGMKVQMMPTRISQKWRI
jgi:hypothetical protein